MAQQKSKYKSNEYHRFHPNPVNRHTEPNGKLRASMNKFGFLDTRAIVVRPDGRGEFVIVEGHNRFNTAMELGIYFWYEMAEDERPTLHEMEKFRTNWTNKDFLVSYARAGRPEYKEVLEYYRTTNIPLQCCLSMLMGQSAGSGNFSASFPTGKFKITETGRTHAAQVADITACMKAAGIKDYANIRLVSALSMCLWVKGFSISRMKVKIKSFPSMVGKASTQMECLSMLEALYNYKVKKSEQVALRFEAKKAADARNVVKYVKDKGGSNGS